VGKAERLASAMEQAESWLEITETFVGFSTELVALVSSTNVATERRSGIVAR
jgi:hypothetical protein